MNHTKKKCIVSKLEELLPLCAQMKRGEKINDFI